MSDEILRSPWFIALASGLLAALITQGLTWWREALKDHRQRHATASYSALVIATQLERFAMDCSHAVQDLQTFQSSNGAGGSYGDWPKAIEYPSNLDWTHLDRTLCSRGLALPNDLDYSRRSIAFLEDVADQDAAGSQAREQLSWRGRQAWLISQDLRRHYGIPPLQISGTGWDFPKILEEEATRWDDRKKDSMSSKEPYKSI